MKTDLQNALEACYLKGYTESALITILDNVLTVDFTSKNPILAGQIQTKLTTPESDKTFMTHDIKTLLKALTTYSAPKIVFKSRTGETDVPNPYCVEVKEGRSRTTLILGIQSTFRKPRIVKTFEPLFNMNITKEFNTSFRNQANILNIETFFIQCNKKNKGSFCFSEDHKKLGDYLEIDTDVEVTNNLPVDLRFDSKTFITILNHYSDSEFELSINERFMTLKVSNGTLNSTYYLAKIKQI